MREIKFRLYDIEKKRIIHEWKYIWSIWKDRSVWHGDENVSDFYILEQFINRHDKDRKELYYGDIINLKDSAYFGDIDGEDFIIKWDQQMLSPGIYYLDGDPLAVGSYQPKSVLWEAEFNIWSYIEDYQITLIGNIHENPKLLESQDA